ncbi:Hypothetical_protein [Hexamita inflata]|uniref:Hypothetical_protein n=1 Tax=Hexamita inflata TaxID=28002 RepID=A0AA86QBL4_9EUKA|nr:Hypothetical protein HINF_LOCUS37644 [Hexamita inflata]
MSRKLQIFNKIDSYISKSCKLQNLVASRCDSAQPSAPNFQLSPTLQSPLQKPSYDQLCSKIEYQGNYIQTKTNIISSVINPQLSPTLQSQIPSYDQKNSQIGQQQNYAQIKSNILHSVVNSQLSSDLYLLQCENSSLKHQLQLSCQNDSAQNQLNNSDCQFQKENQPNNEQTNQTSNQLSHQILNQKSDSNSNNNESNSMTKQEDLLIESVNEFRNQIKMNSEITKKLQTAVNALQNNFQKTRKIRKEPTMTVFEMQKLFE